MKRKCTCKGAVLPSTPYTTFVVSPCREEKVLSPPARLLFVLQCPSVSQSVLLARSLFHPQQQHQLETQKVPRPSHNNLPRVLKCLLLLQRKRKRESVKVSESDRVSE